MTKDIEPVNFLTTIKNAESIVDIGHGILLYENFLKEEKLNLIKNEITTIKENEWNSHDDASSDVDGLISPPVRSLEIFQDRLIDFIIPKYWTNGHIWVSRSAPNLKQFKTKVYRTWTAADYIVVFYIGDFEGGNLVLNSKDNWEDLDFSIPVKENQLYLLPIKNGEMYDTEEVTSGIKYAAVDWIYRHDEIFIG